MGLRNRTQQPFWRITPIRSTDPVALYQHGIECVGKRDGKGMISTGWAICQVAGLHQYQAGDFLTDGYRIWRDSPGFDRAQGAAFLADLFGALCSLTPPSAPADIWSASPEEVMPASIYFGTRCWAGNELLEVATDQETKAQYEPLVYRSAAEAPHDFVPTRSIEFARAYAERNGLPEPWVVVLPGQREMVPAAAGSVSGGAGQSEPSNYAPPSGSASYANYAPPRPAGPMQDVPAGPPADDERERAERERAEREQREREQRERAEQQRLEAERAERERQEQAHQWAEQQRQEQERVRAEQERQAHEQQEREREQSATDQRPRPRPRPTPNGGMPRPKPSPTVSSPTMPRNGNPQPSWPTPQASPAPAPAAQAPAAQAPAAPPAPAPVTPPAPAAPAWQPPAGQAPQPHPAPAPSAPHANSDVDLSEQTVEFVRPPFGQSQQASAPQPIAAASSRENASSVPPRLADLRSKLMSWLGTAYRDVRLESNGWITIPDIGPSVIQIETSIIQGGHLKAEVFAPLVLDVPLTPALFRYVGMEGGRFHFGVMTLDAGEDGTDELGLLQFSHSILADSLQRDELLAVVWLVAATIVARAPELQRRFGGALYADIGR